ncbi:MAG TPA: tRNA dihydrouridine synthase DusB [Syntrophomonadaceae bacterium]|nr:tRNA dihydrouridine synthase DusB [Syntrophomonadaceae bacterium]
MLKIGNVQIKNRVIAAPMAGVTDKAWRIMAKEFNCGLVYTEMVSDMGLVYEQLRTEMIADTKGEEPPITIQIFGSNPDSLEKAAYKVENLGAKIIDINMGCPTPKIVRNGDGAALMLDLVKAREIIRRVVNITTVPITIKFRKGWDDNQVNCVELAGIAEQEGASAIAIHARTRDQYYAGAADWDAIKMVKEQVSIPVIGNGDIWTAENGLQMIDYTNCDAVMIGRASMGNPFIFQQTVELIENGRIIEGPSLEERITTAIKHLDLACELKGELIATREMRKHLAWYIKGIKGAARLRDEINQTKNKEEMIKILNKIR